MPNHTGVILQLFLMPISPPKGLFPISRVNPDFKKNGISRLANPFVLLAISIEPPHRPLSNTAGLCRPSSQRVLVNDKPHIQQMKSKCHSHDLALRSLFMDGPPC
ncbi:MAG: hypothetical protein WKF36_06890 [Candidatus Nitrosocosmicus sp.]